MGVVESSILHYIVVGAERAFSVLYFMNDTQKALPEGGFAPLCVHPLRLFIMLFSLVIYTHIYTSIYLPEVTCMFFPRRFP